MECLELLPGESQGQRSLVGCHLWGHTESDTTEVIQQQSFLYLSSKNTDTLTSSFPIWMAFISFSCLIVLEELPILYNKSDKSKHPCLVLILEKKILGVYY